MRAVFEAKHRALVMWPMFFLLSLAGVVYPRTASFTVIKVVCVKTLAIDGLVAYLSKLSRYNSRVYWKKYKLKGSSVSRVNKLKELFRLVCVAFFAITLVSTLTACSESIDELLDTDVLPEVEFPDPIPPSTPPAEPDIELETLHEVFFGAYGCQRSPALSIVNYNPSLPLENSECFGQSVIGGGNPTQLFDMSDGLYLELDTDVDPLFENEYIVYANDGALFLLDKESNNSRRLTSFSGEICRLLSRKTYLSEFDSSLNQETWREHDDSLV